MPTQVTPGAIPTSHVPPVSKAQAMAQTVPPATPQPQSDYERTQFSSSRSGDISCTESGKYSELFYN